MNRLPIIVFMSGLIFSSCKDNSQNQSDPIAMTQHQDSIKLFLRNYIDEIWNKRDFSKAAKYWGNDFKNVFAPEFEHGPAGMKAQVEYFLSAFNPFHFEIKDIMVDEDKVSMWIEISGTHTGELFGIKPTHKEVRFREAVWYKLRDGKLDEVYPFVDWNSLFEQLGQYPELEEK